MTCSRRDVRSAGIFPSYLVEIGVEVDLEDLHGR